MAYDKSKGGGQQQQPAKVSIACPKAMEIAADTNASSEALVKLIEHLSLFQEGCTCMTTILNGYRVCLAAVQSAEEPKAKEEGAKQAPKTEEPKKDEEIPLLKKLDQFGKKLFG